MNRRKSKNKYFSWKLTQDRIDTLAALLYKIETVFDIVHPGNPGAELTGSFLTDLRQQCCLIGGAEDPLPDMPLTPNFLDREREAA
jgi:hypothetical protein